MDAKVSFTKLFQLVKPIQNPNLTSPTQTQILTVLQPPVDQMREEDQHCCHVANTSQQALTEYILATVHWSKNVTQSCIQLSVQSLIVVIPEGGKHRAAQRSKSRTTYHTAVLSRTERHCKQSVKIRVENCNNVASDLPICTISRLLCEICNCANTELGLGSGLGQKFTDAACMILKLRCFANRIKQRYNILASFLGDAASSKLWLISAHRHTSHIYCTVAICRHYSQLSLILHSQSMSSSPIFQHSSTCIYSLLSKCKKTPFMTMTSITVVNSHLLMLCSSPFEGFHMSPVRYNVCEQWSNFDHRATIITPIIQITSRETSVYCVNPPF